jgi:hypothetical protein
MTESKIVCRVSLFSLGTHLQRARVGARGRTLPRRRYGSVAGDLMIEGSWECVSTFQMMDLGLMVSIV